MDEIRSQQARALLDAGHPDQAERILGEIVSPGGPELMLLAEALEDLERFEDAEFAYKRAVAMGFEPAAVNLGLLLWNMGREGEAETVYRSVAGRDLDAMENLAMLLRDQDRVADAIPVMQRLVQRGRLGWHNELGELYWHMSDTVAAEREFRRGMQSGVESSPCYLGNFYWRQGREDLAEDVFKEALTNNNTSVYFDYALMLSSIEGREADAVAMYERAQDDEALLNLALLHWQLNNREAAQEVFERAIEIDAEAMLPYAEFLDEIGDEEYAQQIRAYAPEQQRVIELPE